ncbi:sugar transporter [Sodiomyces alkalinus F11]|uniref:Sugar transporter n=1 Tax=Sodiomyces alkalinus (strain CBS 110278 / VKM F-3762 / F11) TaxID=1314773 RepID=A0A3N2PRJ4_SODAK|nr:sugar transporter [Sodiomyces alkalinus F11]ROT37115.1 sugar transporter [Sodiomyces alkalinus F11]
MADNDIGMASAVHVDDGARQRMAAAMSKEEFKHISQEAQRASEAEQQLGLRESFKLYPHAIGWSIFLSTCVIMEGFDITLLGNLFAYPPFQRAFGVLQSDGTYQLTAAWQAGLTNGNQVGQIIGLFANGIIAERVGYRWSLIGALAMTTGVIFIIFFSQSLVQLLIGQILIGIPWGAFQTLTVTYASEVCPTHLRAYLTTYVNLCWVIGQFLSMGVLRAMLQREDDWGYRIPFALQWMWPIPLIVGIFFAPESPWWLVRKGRLEQAKRSVLRLTKREAFPDFNADENVSMMVHTNELEKAISAGTKYWDCFKGIDRRRTEIVCLTWAAQHLSGSTMMAFSTYFYQQAGMAVEDSFNMSLGQYAIGGVGTVFSWFLMGWFGRRTLYLTGQVTMCVLLLTIGFAAFAGRDNESGQWAIGSLLLVYALTYNCTVGPICYSLVSELSSTRLKNKTVVLARNTYNILGMVGNVMTTRMLNPSAWNWGARAGFFWAGTCGLCAIWSYFRLPEPKGRTYAELDILFDQRVSARKFKRTVVRTHDDLGDSPSEVDEIGLPADEKKQ